MVRWDPIWLHGECEPPFPFPPPPSTLQLLPQTVLGPLAATAECTCLEGLADDSSYPLHGVATDQGHWRVSRTACTAAAHEDVRPVTANVFGEGELRAGVSVSGRYSERRAGGTHPCARRGAEGGRATSAGDQRREGCEAERGTGREKQGAVSFEFLAAMQRLTY